MGGRGGVGVEELSWTMERNDKEKMDIEMSRRPAGLDRHAYTKGTEPNPNADAEDGDNYERKNWFCQRGKATCVHAFLEMMGCALLLLLLVAKEMEMEMGVSPKLSTF